MNTNWVNALHQLNQQGEAYVLVTLVGVSGSTPRNSGTKMVITADNIYDTIGGGHLEHKTIAHAHKMLASGEETQQLEHFQLGTHLGQCCGGTASVLFEYFAASTVNIMLFGAGHVGKALVKILAGLPCKVHWVDSREQEFPPASEMQQYHNVSQVVSEFPCDEIAAMPANSYYIVMTHNHQLDFELCQSVLARQDFRYLGLIASDTKWRRFQQRFKHREIDEQLVARMNCPIGLSAVPGKTPMEVAVSIAAEVIGLYHQKSQENIEQQNSGAKAEKAPPAKKASSQQGVHWKELKQLLLVEDDKGNS
ncbi:xanthine dehydrogenase accessory protein XdhC [Thalassomonas sp. RHCl1]|uniref:xanthine dehydrogenase accessory protein XdhC n=1 Tax=Thalassomonas sp. RHCl1 TaxID=2995320 RepID=UPI00248BB7A1|nr:xanthine dehydrogenase accessory protein XdhC [Thalassomonas sp. RHCl1]